MLILLIIADIAVFILLILYIFKNILTNYTLSDSVARNVITMSLICICAFTAFGGTVGSVLSVNHEEEIKGEVASGMLDIESEDYFGIMAGIKEDKKDSIKSSIVEISSYIILIAYHEPYKKKKAKEPSKGRWKLDSLNKH